MSKKWMIVLIVVIVLALTGLGAFFFLSQSGSDTNTSDTDSSFKLPSLPKKEVADKDYADPSGYSISYPGDLVVSDSTPESEIYYSVVDLTNPSSKEKLTIAVVDTKYKKVSDWFLAESKTKTDSELTGATSLAGIAANQYRFGKSLFVVAIDQGILYTLESPNTEDWQGISEKVANSFSFAGKSTTTTQKSTTSDDVIYEAEEVVE